MTAMKPGCDFRDGATRTMILRGGKPSNHAAAGCGRGLCAAEGGGPARAGWWTSHTPTAASNTRNRSRWPLMWRSRSVAGDRRITGLDGRHITWKKPPGHRARPAASGRVGDGRMYQHGADGASAAAGAGGSGGQEGVTPGSACGASPGEGYQRPGKASSAVSRPWDNARSTRAMRDETLKPVPRHQSGYLPSPHHPTGWCTM